MSSIQDQLRRLAEHVQTQEYAEIMRTADGMIDHLLEMQAAAVEKDSGNDSNTEWIRLPWGGVDRKSDVRSVRRVYGDCDVLACIEVVYSDGSNLEHYAEEGDTSPGMTRVDVAKQWLADIERQLGVTR